MHHATNLLRSSLTGSYKAVGEVSRADCVAALAFGTHTGPESMNARLGHTAFDLAESRPVMLEETVARAVPLQTPDLVVATGQDLDHIMGRMGTWGVLERMKEHMDACDLRSAIVVAQSWHLGRVALQAQKLGLQPVIPRGLPRQFDRDSSQRWTKRAAAWVPFNLVALGYLKLQGKL